MSNAYQDGKNTANQNIDWIQTFRNKIFDDQKLRITSTMTK